MKIIEKKIKDDDIEQKRWHHCYTIEMKKQINNG